MHTEVHITSAESHNGISLGRGCEVAQLVEFGVVRYVSLRYKSEKLPVRYHSRTVVEFAISRDGNPDEHKHFLAFIVLDYALDCSLRAFYK